MDLEQNRYDCAVTLLGLYKKANAGHVGSSLSCLEILVDLAFSRMKLEDQIILSKGHAAAALYTVLSKTGRLDPKELESFYQDGTRLAAHPPCSGEIPAIPFGTGSLGHGLSLAAGLIFSQRYTGRDFKTFCVLSDGDCNEGSTWEAAMFAAHHQLKNLTVIIDANGLQGIGRADDVMRLEPLAEKWKSFGFEVSVAVNGNSFRSLDGAYASLDEKSNKPRCVIARTIKGSGVSYMSDRMEWHYLPMSDDQYATALADVQSALTGGVHA